MKDNSKSAGQSRSGAAAPPRPQSAVQSRSAGGSAGRSAPPARPVPPRPGADGGRCPGAVGRDRGGSSGGTTEGRQGSVKDMIERLDTRRSGGKRTASPSKRPRSDSQHDSASSTSSEDDVAPGQPLTAETLRVMMQSMTRKIRDDIACQFASLKEEIGRMGVRITELEQHVEQRDNYIQEIEQQLYDRESRVVQLEEEVEQLSCEKKKKDLVFSGAAVPAPPAQPWSEDVTATAVSMLSECLPSVPVNRDDIEESYRVGRGRRIVCRFRVTGKGSVRDMIYENRFRARPVSGSDALAAGDGDPSAAAADGGGAVDSARRPGGEAATGVVGSDGSGGVARAEAAGNRSGTPSRQLYVNENLTRRRQEIFQALLAEKRARKLYTVFTKNCEVYCKTVQYGRKIRVDSMEKVMSVLRE